MDQYGEAVYWHSHPELPSMAQAMRRLMETWTPKEVRQLAELREA